MKRIRRWLATAASADIKPFALLSRAAVWRLGGLVVLVGAGLLAMGQIHPEPVAQRGGVAVIHPWAKGSALKGDQFPFYATFSNSGAHPDRLLKIETAGGSIPVTFVVERAGRLPAHIRVENLGEPEHKDHG